MADFVYFFRLTPAEYWELELPEYDALQRFKTKLQQAQERSRSRRRRS